jgi:hypothetical protein
MNGRKRVQKIIIHPEKYKKKIRGHWKIDSETSKGVVLMNLEDGREYELNIIVYT